MRKTCVKTGKGFEKPLIFASHLPMSAAIMKIAMSGRTECEGRTKEEEADYLAV